MLTEQVEKSVFETILARRSVRQFTKEKLTEAQIETMLEAAIRAPTAMHEEPWGFFISQDAALLKRLSEMAKPLFLNNVEGMHSDHAQHLHLMFRRQDFNIFYNAETLIVICGRKSSPFYAADCWLAAENLMLSACAMNLGTCVIGAAVEVFNIPHIKDALSIPDDYIPVAPIVVGYPEGELLPTARKVPRVFSCRSDSMKNQMGTGMLQT